MTQNDNKYVDLLLLQLLQSLICLFNCKYKPKLLPLSYQVSKNMNGLFHEGRNSKLEKLNWEKANAHGSCKSLQGVKN